MTAMAVFEGCHRQHGLAASMSNAVKSLSAHADALGVSQRKISSLTGISRARIQRIMSHEQKCVSDARISEINAIAKAIGVDHYDLFIAGEIEPLLTENPDSNSLIPFLSNCINGLALELGNEILSIEDVEVAACKSVHADAVRKIAVRTIAMELRRYFKRRHALAIDLAKRGDCETVIAGVNV